MGRYLSSGSSSGGSTGTTTIEQGGTGQVTAPAALAALGGLSVSDLANALKNTQITNLNFKSLDLGINTNGIVNIDRSVAEIQKVTISVPTTISLSNFPANGSFGEILLILINGGSALVTMPTVNWILPTTGGVTNSFATYLAATGRNPSALQNPGKDFILFWSDDGGATVFGKIV